MAYDWGDKEEECYRLYVEERRSLEEVMTYMRDTHGFNPSKRAFQTQFKRWEFPSKQNPAHKNQPLVARTKELWEKNVTQKEMLKILNDEGFDIKERELMRVRAKNRWLLRVPNGMKSSPSVRAVQTLSDQDGSLQDLEVDILREHGSGEPELDQRTPLSSEISPAYSPEVQRKRQLRLEKLQAESDKRWASRKRRRRTRGWAGLPADPPGPPRFPSETTIDESKAYLALSNQLYREMRDQFQSICEEAGFAKKTVAGPEKWQAAKDRLVRENRHLQTIFWADETQLEEKSLSLDVVCTDVTKRMRTLERRMTIAEAKNALGINPEETREIRNAFYATLQADHFTSKLEAGEEHWQELKAQWIAESHLLQSILAPGDADPQHALKVRALEVLCRDVMKRLRDDQTKQDPTRKKQINTGPGPGPAPPRPNASHRTPDAIYSMPAAMTSNTSNTLEKSDHNDLQIDPSLLLAANDPSLVGDPTLMIEHRQQPQHANAQATPFGSAQYEAPHSHPLPIYFRLSPLSAIESAPRLWLNSLSTGTVVELQHLATLQHPGSMVVKIEGVVLGQSALEVCYRIDQDDELDGYLAHVSGGKATFIVQLAYAG